MKVRAVLENYGRNRSDGQGAIQCQKSYEMVNVRGLIDDVVDPAPVMPKYSRDGPMRDGPMRDRKGYDWPGERTKVQSRLRKRSEYGLDAFQASGQEINLFFPFNISQEVPMGNTYQYGRGDNIGGDQVMGDKIGTQINQSQDLVQAAQEIKALLDRLSQDYDVASPVGQAMVNAKAMEAVENDATLRQRVVKALKSAGDEVLEQAIQHPVAKVFVAGAKGFIEG